MAAKPLPDQASLLKLLRYEPATGSLSWLPRERPDFTSDGKWRCWNKRFANAEAGVANPIGYIQIKLFGRQFLAHRIIWMMMCGENPLQIDHINGVRSDNRFLNLRNVTHKENNQNMAVQRKSISGCNGVVWQPSSAKWLAQIRDHGEYRRLGLFADLEDAVRARKAAERKIGFHPNHGRQSKNHIPPVLRTPRNVERNAAIVRDRQSGMTYREIGKKHDLDLSYVRKICLKLKGAGQ